MAFVAPNESLSSLEAELTLLAVPPILTAKYTSSVNKFYQSRTFKLYGKEFLIFISE